MTTLEFYYNDNKQYIDREWASFLDRENPDSMSPDAFWQFVEFHRERAEESKYFIDPEE